MSCFYALIALTVSFMESSVSQIQHNNEHPSPFLPYCLFSTIPNRSIGYVIPVHLLPQKQYTRFYVMALATVKWLEGMTGLDICGESERIEEERAGVVSQHVSGDGDSEDILACDQILTFMEKQLWKLQDSMTREEVEGLLEHKRQYINSLNGVAFQNGNIHQLLSELAACRDAYEATKEETHRLRIINLKLDISDRLSSRHNKSKEMAVHADALRAMITSVQLRYCDLEVIRTGGINARQYLHSDKDNRIPHPEQRSDSDTEVRASFQDRGGGGGGGAAGGNMRRRFIPESEIRSALKRRSYE